MCNLFENTVSFRDLVEAFGQIRWPVLKPESQAAPNLEPLNAIRPTDPAPVLRPYGDGVELTRMRWGFIPARAKAGPITNIRSEGRRLGHGRCLVPATAFFEFTGATSPKTRWRFTETGQPWFCLAGLWRSFGTAGGAADRFTLLTTAPGADMAPIHDRQVVLLPRRTWAAWLSGGPEHDLLQPGPAGALTAAREPPIRKSAPTLPLFGDTA